MICGTCHPEALSEHDREEMGTFKAFLSHMGVPKHWVPLRWQEIDYIRGEGPGVPLMWEGEDG